MNCHIVQNSVVAATLMRNINDKEAVVFPQADPFSIGPIDTIANINNTRKTYWQDLYTKIDVSGDTFPGNLEIFSSKLDEVKSADKVIVWLAPNIDEMIMLCWIVNLFNHFDLDVSKLHFIYVDYDPINKRNVVQLAIFHDQGISYYENQEKRFSSHEISLLSSAWEAICSDTPVKLNSIITDVAYDFLNINGLFKEYTKRYPDCSTGVSALDFTILEAVKVSAPNVVKILCDVVSDLGNQLVSSDYYVMSRFVDLASDKNKEPLLTRRGVSNKPKDMSLTLTDHGKVVLEGKVNNLQFNKIDERIGGVHLDSSTNYIWCRDARTGLLSHVNIELTE